MIDFTKAMSTNKPKMNSDQSKCTISKIVPQIRYCYYGKMARCHEKIGKITVLDINL